MSRLSERERGGASEREERLRNCGELPSVARASRRDRGAWHAAGQVCQRQKRLERSGGRVTRIREVTMVALRSSGARGSSVHRWRPRIGAAWLYDVRGGSNTLGDGDVWAAARVQCSKGQAVRVRVHAPPSGCAQVHCLCVGASE